jgi:hypothetical protein
VRRANHRGTEGTEEEHRNKKKRQQKKGRQEFSSCLPFSSSVFFLCALCASVVSSS